MSDIVWWDLIVTVAIGFVLLVALWPSPDRATRLLRRWGVPEPDENEQAQALTYLKRRRFTYPWLYSGISLLIMLVLGGGGWEAILLSLIVGAVLAELLAQRPPRGPRREAALSTSRVHDLLAPWMLGTWAVLGVAAVGVPLIALLGPPLLVAPAPATLVPTAAAAVAAAVGGIAAGVLVVWLSVRRPPARLGRADHALRLRSARVGAGLSMGTLAAVAGTWNTTAGLVVLLAGLLGWAATTAPVRASAVRTA